MKCGNKECDDYSAIHHNNCGVYRGAHPEEACKHHKPLIADSNAGANVPLDRLVMPRALTAENGAKGLLMGEFYETIEFTCPDCDGGEYHDLETDQCGTCKDTGQVTQEVPVSWTTIKAIYAKAVEHLGA